MNISARQLFENPKWRCRGIDHSKAVLPPRQGNERQMRDECAKMISTLSAHSVISARLFVGVNTICSCLSKQVNEDILYK